MFAASAATITMAALYGLQQGVAEQLSADPGLTSYPHQRYSASRSQYVASAKSLRVLAS
jgi:hypothetical protein